MFSSPAIDESILGDLLKGDAPWDGLGEDLLRRIYLALANNPRMREVYDADTMGLDGWSEFMHGRVGGGAWRRAEIDPPTRGIAVALSILLASLPARAASIEDPVAVAARWSAPADDEYEARDAERARESGHLTPFQQMRAQVARAAIGNASNWLPRLLLSDDLAIRCGAYGSGSLTSEQAKVAFERDGAAAVVHLTDNESLWRTAQRRELLCELAWAVANAAPHSRLDAVDNHNAVRDRMHRAHPEWFADDAIEIDEQYLPATKGDLAKVAEALGGEEAKGRLELAAVQLRAGIEKANARLGWIFWICAGALLAAAWCHF